MKIAIYIPQELPFSIKAYVNNIIKNLNKNVQFYRFSCIRNLSLLQSQIDIFWFPATGRSAPPLKFIPYLRKKKIVLTFHGAANFVLPLKWVYLTPFSRFKGSLLKPIYLMRWLVYKRIANKIITVSNYAKEEFISIFGKHPEIKVIYHGIDNRIFNQKNSKFGDGDYILHISKYQPIKNVERLIEAYKLIKEPKPKLLIISPGFNKFIKDKNIVIIREPKEAKELANYYKNAMAFIFPSLRETFGMPILEAMACGCPVITSNITGCAEVAGNAALLVNPYSITEIKEALKRIIEDRVLRFKLAKLGLDRVKEFSWKKSAYEHYNVFYEVLQDNHC